MIVVDASLVVDFLLGRETTVGDLQQEMGADEHQALHAPELIEPETLNALRRLRQSRALSDRRATEAVRDFGRLRVLRYPHGPLRERVWELRNALTAYDATYLAVAEALHGSILMTADAGLARRARRSIGAARVRAVR